MHDVWMVFLECGWASWICLLVAMPAVAFGLAAVVTGRARREGDDATTRGRRASLSRTLGVVAMVLGGGSLLIGVAGRQMGLMKVMSATSSQAIDPGQRDRIRAEGLREANGCVAVGGAAAALPFVLGAIAIATGAAARKR
jgi:hypothetical protein